MAAPSPFALALSGDVPAAAVVAVPTRPGEPTELAGKAPVDVRGLLERERAKGEAGELVAVPVTDHQTLERVLLVGTGDGSPSALRKA
ncbi:MAG: hypothetical protein WCD35_02070, partial [Mycobacteriales bacterium]